MKVIPLYFNNQTERLFHIDYTIKLPVNPHYVLRTMKVEESTRSPLFEVFTVSDKVYK